MHRKHAWGAATLSLGLAVVMVLLIAFFTQSTQAEAAIPRIPDLALLDNRWDATNYIQGHLIAVQVSPDQRQVADPGTTIFYDHVLTNRGSTTDTIALSLDSSRGWPTSLVDASHPGGTPALTVEVGSLLSVSFQISLNILPVVGTSSDRITVTATSRHDPSKQDTAVDLTVVWPLHVYLPLLVGVSQPLPGKPTLSAEANYNYGGYYCLQWADPTWLADTYFLEQACDDSFHVGPGRCPPHVPVWGYYLSDYEWCAWRYPPGVYYYRVRGQNEWGDGPYSNVVVVSVFPPSRPEMYPIDNADGDGNYTVRWGPSLGALGYILVEATTPDFTRNASTYGTGPEYWTFTDKTPATYYYKVMGQGYHDNSAWSNVVSVTVITTNALHLHLGEE